MCLIAVTALDIMTYLINYESGAIKKITKLTGFQATVKILIILTCLKAKIERL